MMSKPDLKKLAIKLFEINAFKFGDFKMKVGINSPVYFDLRVIVSHPDVMETLSNLLMEFVKDKNIPCEHVCGVPYTALPLATLISVSWLKPMLIRRKEAKAYGTKKLIEGKYNAGDRCLIIEDVVTSGSSILETVSDLRSEGIDITDAIVVVDREQGGVANIAANGVRMHSLFTLSYLLNVLKEAGKIEESTVQAVGKYIAACQIKADGSFVNNATKIVNELDRTKMTFEARADLAKCKIAKTLFQTMATKKTNLCVAADLTTGAEILRLADAVGPHICMLKTHVDIISDYSHAFITALQALSEKHNFLLMEDRKFADIGNTVALQYGSGPFNISSWAHLVTAHSLPGQGILKGFKNVLKSTENRGVFLLAEFSSSGSTITPKYTEATVEMATNGPDVDFVAGIVCQNKSVFAFPGIVQLTPGVKIEDSGDNLGQQYNTPEYVVIQNGADVAVVGRGVIQATNAEQAAQMYRNRLWTAYCERINMNVN